MKFFLASFLIIGTFRYSFADDACQPIKPCPSIKPLGNFEKPDELQCLISGTILNLWELPKPTPSESADELERVLVTMFASDNCEWQNVTLGSSYLFWILAPQIERNPGLCTYSKIVDANIKDCCKSKKKALKKIPAAFSSAAQLIAATALRNSGCGNSTYVPPIESCRGDGKNINIKALLENLKGKFPPEFECALRRVCKSKKPQNQVMCVATASTTLPEFRALIGEFSDELRLSFFKLLLSPRVPQRCCKEFQAQIDHLLSVIDAEAKRATDVTLAKIKCCKKMSK